MMDRITEEWAIRKRQKFYNQALIVKVPQEVKELLEEEAQKQGLTLSELVRLAIQEWFKHKQNEPLG